MTNKSGKKNKDFDRKSLYDLIHSILSHGDIEELIGEAHGQIEPKAVAAKAGK